MPSRYGGRDLSAYSAAQTLSGPATFDRGIPDTLGYLTLSGLPAPPHVAASARAARYTRRVFLAPFWDAVFGQDAKHKRTRAEAKATLTVTRETYIPLEYEIT